MKITEFIKNELQGWGKYEKIIFPICLLSIVILSVIKKDNPIAIISAICGLSYTILAGKGKISCYYIGICGTLCYAYLSFKAQLFGNLVLYLFYYLPMQTIGIFQWRKHLQKTDNTIKKAHLTKKEQLCYASIGIILTIATYFILLHFGDKSPIIDSITTIFSILGLFLTVKRCIEQWYIWFIVNGLSTIMWIKAYLSGMNVLATVLMWFGYFILSIYFLYTWSKEMNQNNE